MPEEIRCKGFCKISLIIKKCFYWNFLFVCLFLGFFLHIPQNIRVFLYINRKPVMDISLFITSDALMLVCFHSRCGLKEQHVGNPVKNNVFKSYYN